ncbi:ribonuclease Z [Flavobacterium sp. xlx-214]|uniref:ribonuclease Z n=1 Tax=unclassified Flavobacterium TaxID=196869 RepID=UPI0013D88648|nr:MULTISPECIES: ribonuclease Z [unclassified Flavobacterium]MBA5793127.1 ribonuclease Z [Flavobacterium sp. xlx-221]QMI82586.1 ribonuclease Z [Flavobacterium sp. xlx-214]
MKVKEKNNTVVFKKSSDDFSEFIEKIIEQPNLFKNKNILIDLEEIALRPSQIISFEPLAVLQKKQKKSFVIVADIDFDEVSEEIIVVPTLQEGFDIIEMEEIERDLGF